MLFSQRNRLWRKNHVDRLKPTIIFKNGDNAYICGNQNTIIIIMAKFRANHQTNMGGSGLMPKIGIFIVLAGGLLWAFNQFSGGEKTLTEAIEEVTDKMNRPNAHTSTSDGPKGPGEAPDVAPLSKAVFPTTNLGKIVEQDYYALSYVEEHEQPEWVAYTLTREHLYPNTNRTNNFRPDPKVPRGSASDRDYRGSGYDRGHLVPAGDMTFSREAMSQTFYMSNMSPQVRNFNGGIWRELEESVRYWTKKFRRLYIVTGPVLTEGIREKIGGNGISVPDQYYKVLLDLDEPEIKAIGFLIPNEVSVDPLNAYAVPIDEIEALTGLDFFSNIINDPKLEAKLESGYHIRQWSFSKKKFKQRVEQWNRR